MSKFVIVTGGIVPNIGKGITAGGLARLFKNRGLKVTMQKIDQFLNVDPGTMSPYQHGEVFVTEDGTETTLDIGHYERFLDENLTGLSNVSGGKIYSNVINRERLGKFVGATVQVVPDVTDEIDNMILALSNDATDIVIVEIGGTVNEYESGVYYHAIRELSLKVGSENVFLLHIDMLPYVETTKEVKVESIQTSVQKLNSFGLFPDAVVCRVNKNVAFSDELKTRVQNRCFLKSNKSVIGVPNLDTIYEIPSVLKKEGLDSLILAKFNISKPEADLNSWDFMVKKILGNYSELRICIVGKYTNVPDAYISIIESIKHASTYNQVTPKIEMIDAEDIEEYGVEKFLKGAKGIIVPPGWGSRGFMGMIQAIRYARENKIPYLGIGLGMQLAVIEYARDVIGMAGANTTEIDQNTAYPVIDVMEEQKKLAKSNGISRVGAFNCALDPNSKCGKLYGAEIISERHRHRYEFNTKYSEKFESSGMTIAGMEPDSKLVEIIELKAHPFFVSVIFEPEFKSRPNRPHPLFLGFINTAKSVR